VAYADRIERLAAKRRARIKGCWREGYVGSFSAEEEAKGFDEGI
jgi:hypothetical protein